MNIRNFVEKLDSEDKLIKIRKEVSTEYEISALLKEAEGKAVKFENVKDQFMPVVGGIGSSREMIWLLLLFNLLMLHLSDIKVVSGYAQDLDAVLQQHRMKGFSMKSVGLGMFLLK